MSRHGWRWCHRHRRFVHTFHWTSGQKPHLTENGKRIVCNISNYVPFVVPGLSTNSSTHRHLLLHLLHHRILYLTSGDFPKIQHPKEVEVRVRSCGETRCIDHQKPKTKIKMMNPKKYTGISEKIWSMKVALWSHGETLRLRIKTLPVLFMN